MKVKYLSILFATILGGVLMTGAVSATDALTWQDEVDVQFTFNPALSISLSSADIVIEDLSPNTSADSNQISVTVRTNNVTGYQLNATVGNASHAYRTLLHTNGTNSFASIDVGSSMTTLPEGNYWGYSANDGVSFSGLPLYSDTENVAVLNSSDGAITEITPFRIKARAAATQTAGDYSNVINFVAVTNAVPEPAMQNMDASLCTTDAPTTVRDTRDNEEYLVQRLADGNCWMLKNLNLAGGTALSATDTDVDSSYISSFTTSGNLTKTGDTIVLPTSSTSGFDTNNNSYVYNSGNKTNCGASDQNTPCYSYYSWDAATLGSGRTIETDNTDAPYSICPKGWRLPTAYSISAANWQTTSDFYILAHQYGLDSTTITLESDDGFYTQAGPGTVPNFLLAGYYYDGSFYGGGSGGYFWSATSYSSTDNARYLGFSSSNVNSAYSYNRSYGRSVRCLLAE